MNEERTMVGIPFKDVTVLNFENGTGKDLKSNDFTVFGASGAVAQHPVKNTEVGVFFIGGSVILTTSNFDATEAFDAVGGDVLWNIPDKKFQWEKGATAVGDLRKVGVLTQVKNAEGEIQFDKLRFVEAVV